MGEKDKMNEEEKIAKLELNRFIYGKQLSKDDIVDYISILFNLIDRQQKEIEEKTTIIMAGAEKVKGLEKEIEELKEYIENEKKCVEDIGE